ncbi:MAG TPA: putative quinol monooxygenase [Acidimicrobiales bacterium]|jgi:quinol monooxygenase YgiN|nr:putative quinol monooxygenase [Acidimicrobiales bacterium]
MIIIAGTISFDPANADLLAKGFDTMQAFSLKEDGCLAYDYWPSRHEAGTVLMFEKWESDEALAAHMTSPHMAEFGKVMGQIGIRGVDVKKYSGATEGPLR